MIDQFLPHFQCSEGAKAVQRPVPCFVRTRQSLKCREVQQCSASASEHLRKLGSCASPDGFQRHPVSSLCRWLWNDLGNCSNHLWIWLRQERTNWPHGGCAVVARRRLPFAYWRLCDSVQLDQKATLSTARTGTTTGAEVSRIRIRKIGKRGARALT